MRKFLLLPVCALFLSFASGCFYHEHHHHRDWDDYDRHGHWEDRDHHEHWHDRW